MNRQTRRIQAAQQRKGISGAHATASFADLVGKANTEALKPFILEQVEASGKQVQRNIARIVIDATAKVQTRIMVLERILMDRFGLTKQDMATQIAIVEDEATGYVASSGPAEKGDFLRVTILTKGDKDSEFGEEAKINLNSLAVEPYQTYQALEDYIVGMIPGETKEIPVMIPGNEGDDEVEQYTFKVTVDRISRKPAPKPAEVASAEASGGGA